MFQVHLTSAPSSRSDPNAFITACKILRHWNRDCREFVTPCIAAGKLTQSNAEAMWAALTAVGCEAEVQEEPAPEPKNWGDERYQGWRTPSTWSAYLWLGNDEVHYRKIQQLMELEGTHEQFVRRIAGYCRYEWGHFDPDGHALDTVDWDEIATAFSEPIEVPDEP